MWWIPLAIIGVIVLWAISAYNSLVNGRNQVKNGWAQIDVQLKRRFDLIPNLVETVKGYAKHEQETLKVIQARNAAMGASSVEELAAREGELRQTLRSLFALSENYDLKANQNFLKLQDELSGTENKISLRASFTTMSSIAIIPDSNFPNQHYRWNVPLHQEPLFEVDDPAEREAPQVKF